MTDRPPPSQRCPNPECPAEKRFRDLQGLLAEKDELIASLQERLHAAYDRIARLELDP
jgi:hypothetical protein